MLGPKIRQIREQLGLSQKQLAGEDMTRSYISLIEKGRAVPSQRMLKIIARRLNTPMEFFLGGSAATDTDIGEAVLDKAKACYAEQNDSACIRIAHKVLTLTEDTSDQSEAYLLILRSHNRLGDYRQALDEGETAAFTVIRTGDRNVLLNIIWKWGERLFMQSCFMLPGNIMNRRIRTAADSNIYRKNTSNR